MGIAARACYDPEAAVLWVPCLLLTLCSTSKMITRSMHERLAKATGDSGRFALLRTHPVSETRIQVSAHFLRVSPIQIFTRLWGYVAFKGALTRRICDQSRYSWM